MAYHKWSLVIMRAQPFHNWHMHLVNRALQTTPNVLLFLGSMSQERTARNPFLIEERKAMIRAVYPYAKRLKLVGLIDKPGDDAAWRASVEHAFEAITGQERGLLIANCKPGEDYLERIFHNWDRDVTYHNYSISATDIRRLYFETGDGDALARYVPAPVLDWLAKFAATEGWDDALNAYMQGLSNAS